MLYKFDTKVQYLKYKVLREVARHAWDDTLLDNLLEIPKTIVPGNTPTMRCCVYKERAILGERVKIAMGGDKSNPNVIEVIETACDECPMGGYEVTNACRGCLAHRCMDACRFGAITFDQNHVAHIISPPNAPFCTCIHPIHQQPINIICIHAIAICSTLRISSINCNIIHCDVHAIK